MKQQKIYDPWYHDYTIYLNGMKMIYSGYLYISQLSLSVCTHILYSATSFCMMGICEMKKESNLSIFIFFIVYLPYLKLKNGIMEYTKKMFELITSTVIVNSIFKWKCFKILLFPKKWETSYKFYNFTTPILKHLLYFLLKKHYIEIRLLLNVIFDLWTPIYTRIWPWICFFFAFLDIAIKEVILAPLHHT